MNREYKHHNPKLYKPIMETLIKELGNLQNQFEAQTSLLE